ncbi:M42 family metallopeptidase [Bauldia litoralis]|uniref:Putative aminopeptidase FrvX n=1 Tax=Bauldia litoralis TaxID=665467 RepID=A0A1G6EJ95_9HYPH|nr:M42 family peptidase [Bauldia litoralis]SDB57440.1 Putative aminopeptidase FrvX [Bauldia litoralis]
MSNPTNPTETDWASQGKAALEFIRRAMQCHSPSGVENEINRLLVLEIETLRLKPQTDGADNIFIEIPGEDNSRKVIVTAHKDELGMLVRRIDTKGVIEIDRLNGAYPWVYGEGPVDIIGDCEIVQGVLGFGSRHVSEPSPTFYLQGDRALLWSDARIETKLSSSKLANLGVRVGSPVVLGRPRKSLLQLPDDFIAGYALDNRASMAVLLLAMTHLGRPRFDTIFAFTSKEELGGVGALHLFSYKHPTDVIALEILPESEQCEVSKRHAPHLLVRDGHGIYDDRLNREIFSRGSLHGIEINYAILARGGSDGSIAMKYGAVPRAANLCMPTSNSHGFEITSLRAIISTFKVLQSFLY